MNRIIFVFCLALITIAASACPTSQKKADAALNAGSFVDAEKIAREDLKSTPEDPTLELVLAEALNGQQKYLDAHPIILKLSLGVDEKSATIPSELYGRIQQAYGKTEWELGRTLKAVSAWSKAREFDKNLVPEEQYIRAIETAIQYAESKFDFSSSIQLRQELRELDPENAAGSDESLLKTKQAQARSLERNGKYEDAILAYKSLHEQHPENHKLLFSVGHLQAIMRDRRAEAEATFQKYIALSKGKDNLKRTLEVASRLESLNVNELAVKFYQRAVDHNLLEKPERRKFLLVLARLQFDIGAHEKAKSQLDSYLKLSNLSGVASARPYIKTAEVAVTGRKALIAIEILERGIKEANPNWRLSRMLADLYSRRGKSKDSERVLEFYITRTAENEKDGAKKAGRYIEVGRWASGRRKFKLAKYFYEKAVLIKEVDDLAFLELAKVYAALGYLSELRRTMKLYTTKKGEKKTARYLQAAGVYESQRMYEEAEKMYLSAIKEKDAEFSTVRSLENLYRSWGKPKRIAKVFEKWIQSRGGKAADYLTIGERFYRQANWANAEKYLKLAAKGGESEAWITLADIYKRNQNGSKMKDAIDNYLKSSPKRALALNEAARRYSSSRWSDNAIPIYEELIATQPTTFSHYKSLSEIYFAKNKKEEAVETLEKYINQSSKKAKAMETIQRSYSRQHAESIVELFEKILEKEKDPDPQIYKILGDAHRSERRNIFRPRISLSFLSQPDKTKHYYKLYLEKATPNKTELKTFASLLMSLRYWDLAASTYKKMELEDATSSATAATLFDFGTVLLHIGESERAEGVFSRYYKKRKESVDAAQRIVDQLYQNNRLKSAEPYLVRMLESSNDNMKQSAFVQLVNVFISTDRSDKIQELAAKYIEEAQNPEQARKILLTTLRNRGLWDLASNQLEKMIKDNSDELAFQLAQIQFTQGRDEEVRETLTEFASEHVNPVDAWTRVANFYKVNGWMDDAENAFSNASQNASNENDQRGLQALFEFAKFDIQRGNVDAGQAKFKEGRKRLNTSQKEAQYFAEITALKNMGYHDRAQKIAKEALPKVFSGKTFLFSTLAEARYFDNREKKQRRVDEIKASGINLREVVSLLAKENLFEDAIEAIDKEAKSGDQRTAAEVLAENIRLFLDVGGTKRLFQSAQPLLDANQPSLYLPLASILIAKGEFQRAVILLKRVKSQTSPAVDQLLARCYLHLDNFEAAFEHLQNDLRSSPNRPATLMGFVTKAENTNHGKAIDAAIAQLARDPNFRNDALPIYISRLLDAQKIDQASDAIRTIWTEEQNTETASKTQAEKIKKGIHEFAAAGFGAEGLFLLSEVPAKLKKENALIELEIELLAFSEGEKGDKILLSKASELGNSPDENSRKLTIAKFAIASQRYNVAAKVADPILNLSQLTNSSQALSILISAHQAGLENAEGLDSLLKRFFAAHEDKNQARLKALSVLHKFDLHTYAAPIATAEYKSQPTEISVHNMLRNSVEESATENKKWIERLWRTSSSSLGSLKKLELNQGFIMSPSYELILDHLEKVDANSLVAVKRRARWFYLNGQTQKGREHLQAFLSRHSEDAQSFVSVLRFLDEWGMPGEIVSWATKGMDTEAAPQEALQIGAVSLIEIGMEEQGLAWIDLAMKKVVAPYRFATTTAHTMVKRGNFSAAKVLIDKVIKKHPQRLAPYYVSAVALIGMGDAKGATEHFQKSEFTTFPFVLFRTALRNNQVPFAEEIAKPFFTDKFSLDAIRFVLRQFVLSRRAKEGVAFLEKHAPALVERRGVPQTYSRFSTTNSTNSLLWPLGDLYEAAGVKERAKEFIKASLEKTQYSNWYEMSNPANSLAYKNATTNTDIDEGEKLIQLSLAFFPYFGKSSSASAYIDTLGWIQYRQGKLNLAEETIRRAILKQDNETFSAHGREVAQHELLAHLEEVLEKIGKNREASKLDFRLRLLEKRDSNLVRGPLR